MPPGSKGSIGRRSICIWTPGKLKRLLAAADQRRSKRPRQPRFVELIAPAPVASPECVIEFESASGRKMRIQWKTAAAPDWANLLRAWRDCER